MPVQTEHRSPLDLSVLDAAGNRVTLADMRGQARAVAEYFMRTGTCPACTQHTRTLARLDLPCPPAASTAQRCRPRSTGCNAPTILPQRAAKG
jgi:hypothetical protein